MASLTRQTSNEEEGTERPPHKANINDEFLRHPESGAFFRNPLCEKGRLKPICFSNSEYHHNCLDEALRDWPCIAVSETSYRDMVSNYCAQKGNPLAPNTPRHKMHYRADLNKLTEQSGFDFTMTIRKSAFVQLRIDRRGRKEKEGQQAGTHIDKLNIEVREVDSKLRIESITEGLVTAWNRNNPAFIVKAGDHIIGVNHVRMKPAAMMEEMHLAPEIVKVLVRRMQADSDMTSPRMARLSSKLQSQGTVQFEGGGAQAGNKPKLSPISMPT